MVQVIQREKPKEVTCFKCESILSYVYTEIREDYSTDYLGGRDYYHYIECPVCSARVYVNSK